MDRLNEFLMGLSLETRNATWYGFVVLYAILISLFVALYSSRKGKRRRECCAAALTALATTVVVIVLAYGIDWLTDSAIYVTGNIYFLPGVLACAMTLKNRLKWDFRSALDLVVVAFTLARSIHVLGCAFSGCCQGYPVSWGIYSAVSKTTVVPVSEIESLCLFTAWFFLNRYYRRFHFDAHGIAAAYGLIAIGAINYVADIFTVGFEKIVYMTSLDGLVPFIAMVTGLILLYIFEKNPAETNSVFHPARD